MGVHLMIKVLVILPALNEEKTIGSVLAKIGEVLVPGIAIETLVIDDGSTDSTSRISCQCGAAVVRHDHNRGVGAAFQAGLKEAVLRNKY